MIVAAVGRVRRVRLRGLSCRVLRQHLKQRTVSVTRSYQIWTRGPALSVNCETCMTRLTRPPLVQSPKAVAGMNYEV